MGRACTGRLNATPMGAFLCRDHLEMLMLATLRSIWVWGATAVLILLWLPVMAVTRLFERSPYYRTGFLFRKLGHTITMLNPLWS